jgi:hypothetical protein
LSAQLSCPFVCAPPKPPPCVPKDCDGNPVAARYVSYDVNDDCKISVADANAIINHIAANPELGERSAEYDANGDERVTALDALNVSNYIGRNQCEESCVPVNCFGTQVAENQVAYDTNQDCKITSADASGVRAHIDANPDVKNRDAQYDANGDGIIDEKDAAVIDGYLVEVLCMELPTPTPTPTATPIPSGACLTDGKNTRLTSSNRLEYYYDDKKPGIWRTETALTGLSWPNGGTLKKYDDIDTSKLDWNLCPNIGFYERGHSLTRKINFINPQEDGEYTLVVHRVRNKDESFGVSIRYWFEGSKVSFSRGAIRDRGNWRIDFNLHQDYNFTCSYKQDREIPWRCSVGTTSLSAIICNRWHHSRFRNGCREIDVQ